MALQLSILQSGGKLHVFANNTSGDHVVIVDHIIVSVVWSAGGSWHTWYYQDDFLFGSGRVDIGFAKEMVAVNYAGLPANAHATADFWEVDQRVKSPVVDIT